MELGYEQKQCRMCGSQKLYPFLDLGMAPIADAILSKEHLEKPEPLFPLRVCQCEDCGLTQLGYVVAPEVMYGDQYHYESSITTTGKNHFFAMASDIVKKCNLQQGKLAVDIGSNVGVLLEGFNNNGLEVLGIDPSPHICKIANARGIETWQEFFGPEVAKKIVAEKGQAAVVTGTNVFAHIDDKKGLMQALELLLAPGGVFVIEAPYMVDLLEHLEYDTVYLEHLEYTSLKPLVLFFKKYGMEVFDVERTLIHGASIRVFVAKKGERQVSAKVAELLALEEKSGIYNKETLDAFAKKVQQHKKDLLALLEDLKNQGKKIVGISAPAKGNTMLNYCGIGCSILPYVTEKSAIKIGHYTPGMRIPIVAEEQLLKDKPDYGIIFAWNFADEIMKNNVEFTKNGGKFIIPIPHPTII